MTIINDHYDVLETEHGLMLVNRHDPTLYETLRDKKCWAKEELDLTQQYATGVVVDVGANIGTHTLSYAKTADHVFAFEPQPFVFDNLCANLLLNNVIDVTPVQCALGSTTGYTTMRIQEPTVLNSPMGCRVNEGDNRIAIRTLDTLGLPPISFIKIDVEAHELEVLKGAAETLKNDRPVVYVEIHYKHLINPIIELMQGLGYTATPAIITHVTYPDTHVFEGNEMLEVYGFLFKRTELVA